MLPPIPSHYTFGATVPLYESNQIEFKVSTISFDKLKKTVCAFLNTIGGYIFIGINDSRQICGIEPKIADNIALMVDQLICLKSVTRMDDTELTIREASAQIVDVVAGDGRVILIIKVQPASLSEDYMCSTGECYFRLNASNYCRRSDASEIIQLRSEIAKLKSDKLKLNGYINMLSGTLRRSLVAEASAQAATQAALSSPWTMIISLFHLITGDCLIGPGIGDGNDLHHVATGYLSTTYM
jgi:predicted HTH transcriptional regulator